MADQELNQAHHRSAPGSDFQLVTLLDEEAWLLAVKDPPEQILMRLAKVEREIEAWNA